MFRPNRVNQLLTILDYTSRNSKQMNKQTSAWLELMDLLPHIKYDADSEKSIDPHGLWLLALIGDPEKKYERLLLSYNSNSNPYASYIIATTYINDINENQMWICASLNNGSFAGSSYLGYMVTKDPKYLKIALKGNWPQAILVQGSIETANGNHIKAFLLCKKYTEVVKNPEEFVMHKLIKCYLIGEGVTRNIVTAIKLVMKWKLHSEIIRKFPTFEEIKPIEYLPLFNMAKTTHTQEYRDAIFDLLPGSFIVKVVQLFRD